MNEENFFHYSQNVFKFFQIWPHHDGANKALYLLKVIVITSVGTILAIISLSEAIEELRYGEISDALSKGLFFVPLIICTQKITAVALARVKINACIEQMENLSRRFKDTSDIEKCLRLYKKLIFFGIYCTVIGGGSFLMAPLTTGTYRSLPFTPHFSFLNVIKTPNWQLIYIYEIVAVIFISVPGMAYDTLFCGMMCVSSGILSSICLEVRELENIIEDHQTLETKMKEIIDKLNEITELVSKVSGLFSATTVTLVIYNCSTLGLGLFMVKFLPFGLQFFAMNMMIVLVIFQLWIYCYFGQAIVNQREILQMELYSTRWYDASKNFKFMLLLTIFESQIDRYVYAGKIIPLSLETFTQVVKKAYAFFTFLNEAR